VHERAPVFGVSYTAFVDPSGGSADSMAMAIGHRQDGATIIDAMRERRPPFSPEDVVGEFAALLRDYRISKVTGDRYGGEWPRERFRAFCIAYEPAGKATFIESSSPSSTLAKSSCSMTRGSLHKSSASNAAPGAADVTASTMVPVATTTSVTRLPASLRKPS
jgi:hypothetical protein